MPIYEFYCPDCHTIYNFFSRRINTDASPDCPGCGRPGLDRRMSSFAISKGRRETGDDIMPEFDESRLEQAMMSMSGELENMNEEDPVQAARLMKKLSRAADIKLGDGLEEALRRLEAGDDPDAIEADMGDILESENPFAARTKNLQPHKKRPPQKDDTLYEL